MTTLTKALGPGLVVAVLLVGYVKGSAALPQFPIDLTAVAVGLLAAVVLGHAVLAEFRLPVQVLVLGAVFAVPVFALPASEYAATKSLYLFGITLFISVAAGIVASGEDRIWWLMRWFVFGALLIGLVLRLSPAEAELYGRFAIDGTNTLAIGRSSGAGLLALVLLVSARKMRWQLAAPAAAIFLTLMFGSGSRGPLLAAMAAVMVVVAARRGARRIKEAIVIGLLGTFGFVWALGSANAASVDRIFLLFAADRGDSVSVRQLLYGRTIDVIESSPLGVGWGGLEPTLQPLARYPHNIFLEIFAEAGWIPGVVFCLVLGIALLRARHGGEAGLAVLGMLTYWLINAQFSGDVNDNRALFALIGVALVLRTRSDTSPRLGSSEAAAKYRVDPVGGVAQSTSDSVPLT